MLLAALAGSNAAHASAGTEEYPDQYFERDGIRLRYVVAGRHSGEWIVFLHGLWGSVETDWTHPIEGDHKIFSTLARNFRVVAMDCRGHGKSSKPHCEGRYGKEMVLDVIGLMDHLEINRAHLVGFSMGSVIGGAVVVKYPDRVVSAVFLVGAPMTPDSDTLAGRRRQFVEDVDARGLHALPDIWRAGQDPWALVAVSRRTSEFFVTVEDLRKNEVPLLAITGTEDFARPTIQFLQRRMPHLEVMVLNGATHETVATQTGVVARIDREDGSGCVLWFVGSSTRTRRALADAFLLHRPASHSGHAAGVALEHGGGPRVALELPLEPRGGDLRTIPAMGLGIGAAVADVQVRGEGRHMVDPAEIVHAVLVGDVPLAPRM
ncbi:MAG: alpha/beta fold hydrolase [Verrucomicrobiales bacterium]|nr:alpha/beta fold hydrolase [Verrucomicrobiales bacterium]